MVFSVTEFLQSPTVADFEALKKDELVAIALHFNLVVKSSMKKQEVRGIVVKKFVDEQIFKSDDLPPIVKAETNISEYEFELEKLRKDRQFQLEKERLEREERDKDRQFQLEKLRLEHSERSTSHVRYEFDAAKNIRLVPKFQEKSVDKFFPQFEKIAEHLQWPFEVWPTLLQSVLVGKAAEVYSALS
ncbi:uncharacterized protein LOC112042257 [Lingula anatina]|uniref:Uncharacterized protein LOC112042257 n=1 Tax=Lingula anatina TaxID=7574 RepID=A0A2R2MQK1_LINAN|nr:uncharacterized protein LOC112042257 [Lingula anatina]|eukprot:XP_023932287.1 uncharacterized protein LOC112042257 [Lingula anatina]